MNRSMEAHAFLSKKGFFVKSFGTGDKVKLPGTALDKPNVYDFGCSYDEIYQDLLNKDKTFYTQNGLLHMLDRNRRIKTGPERFQSSTEKFDIIITCEERVYDQVIEALEGRPSVENSPVHIINIDIQDNHEEATIGAFLLCELVTKMSQSDDLDNDIDELLHDFEAKCDRAILHCVMFY
ncbi:RNA polymerase II subunit A C-terminal domain phosphatase [Polyplax serrata]